MTQINAYLTFNGRCREAMSFYKECLGGELTLQTVAGTPMEDQCPEGMKHHIMHSVLVKDNMVLMATDMVSSDGFETGNNIALSLNCSSEQEIKTFFANLSRNGKIIEPLTDKSWGALFGALKDKFGINWMFNYNKSQT